MAAEKKIAEAQECVRQAEKWMKTSFFKFKPDYDLAASEYGKAATHYKNAKCLQQCKECLIKASECNRLNHSFFAAAKSLDQAAMVTRDMGDVLGAADLIERACQLFREHGSPDTAATTFEKGAKMVESQHPERALSMYIKASDVVMLEERPRQAAEYVGKASRILVRLGRYDEAANNIRKEIDLHLISESQGLAGRMVVALVLVELARGDTVAAQKAFQEGMSYAEEEEVGTLASILEAFDQEDAEMAYRALKNPFIVHMDVEYSKLARRLRVPETSVSSSRGKVALADGDDAGSGLADDMDKLNVDGGGAAAREEDDYSGGLC